MVWAKATGAVGSSTVVSGERSQPARHGCRCLEDQNSVGEFGSDGADDPFVETVRSRVPRRNPDHLHANVGEDGINYAVNWPGFFPLTW